MIKIEAVTLEEAYSNAADTLKCSVTELKIEVVQVPSSGFLGLFKKSAIIVAVKEVITHGTGETHNQTSLDKSESPKVNAKNEDKIRNRDKQKEIKKTENIESKNSKQKKDLKTKKTKQKTQKKDEQNILNDTIMPASFVSTQDDEDEYGDVNDYLADYEEEDDYCEEADGKSICTIVESVQKEINELFDLTCFKIDKIEVSAYSEDTLLIEFKGDDAALLIGKEGYRYKALSYMIFNWINTKYQVQLRLEIAEFLKNQEESVAKYLVGVCENIEKDGRAQTKILDGVLIQIALNELRNRYPDKYIVIRSTRDGLKYIIVNDYHSN